LTSALAHYDSDSGDQSPQANDRKAVRLTSQISSLVATMGRQNTGAGPIPPDPVLGHAANFLYMLTGERPSGLATRAFDVALILHADHELNASTFAALVKAEKKLYANVDFYSASTYHALGIAIDLFTPIFAVSRVSGWTAHVLEQYANNRLIRPRADYIGPEYPQRYQPLDAR